MRRWRRGRTCLRTCRTCRRADFFLMYGQRLEAQAANAESLVVLCRST